mgnify:CR=1 FL=1
MNRQKLIRAAIFLVGFGFVIGAFTFVLAFFTVGIPNPNDFVNTQATVVQYSNGKEIGRYGDQNRTIVPLAKIPLHLREAVMAAEDRNFYNNRAFSITGLTRAVIDNIVSLGRGGGGSTITQQYAKTAFLSPERSIQRKIKELVIAIKLENQLSKDQILENYLNTIYFGRGAYGVETAANQYFNRSVGRLTIPQAAVLASILRSPGFYDPSYSADNKKRLEVRFNYVLDGSGQRFRVIDVLNDTSNTEVKGAGTVWMDKQFLINNIQKGPPAYYNFNGVDSNGDTQVDLYPIPDGAYTLRFNLIIPQPDLSSDNDRVLVAGHLVSMLAYAKAIAERGEDSGILSSEAYQVYRLALADAVAIERNRYLEEVVWVNP